MTPLRIHTLFILLITAFVPSSPTMAQSARPNIIYIMADDMGYGDAGCYGQKLIQTPSIDRMAAEGMRFTSAYAGSTVCAPSRSVLMTGLHTGHTRVRGNFGKFGVKGLGGGDGRVPLQAEDVTVAEVLKSAGYATGITGKWGLGEPATDGTPNKQGFDAWFGFLNQRRAHNHYADFLWLNEDRFPLLGNVDKQQEQLYSHDLFSAFAINFIRRQARLEQPFFLYVPYTVPHSRFQVPSDDPYATRNWDDQEIKYAAMITRLDSHVGRIIDLLQELKIDNNTIVFFCSDNGAADRYEGRFNSSGDLRGRKRDMYEGGLRVPMVVRWPGRVPAGAVSDLAWSFGDFLPTAAELADVPAPKNLDGTSIAPTLMGGSQNLADRKLYWEFFEKGFQQAVRWKNWKAIRPGVGKPLELYNLEVDLGETLNVANKRGDVVADIEDYLKTARTESIDWPLPVE